MEITKIGTQSNLTFYIEPSISSGIQKIADKVRLDVHRVTDALPSYGENLNALEGNLLIFAIIDQSPVLKKLELEKKINLSEVRGKREVYSFSVVENPFFELPRIKSAIVIAGSDKRGVIYGLFHLSEIMKVSPFVDWLDIKPPKQQSVVIDESQNFVSKEPSVKYRGFFINDEWPAFGNWTNKRYGGFNAKMYEHVFELLLRLKGNYLWPAMWSARFSDDGPNLENAKLADELGVIMGTSHHEPCFRAGEEYRFLRGQNSIYGDAWNFRTNKEGITKFWEDGLKRNGEFENVITVGMRGEADTAIMKNATLKDNIELLRDVISTQNELIKKYVNPSLEEVPRMLALYKEVEPYFYGDKNTKGLIDSPELEGVTLMLCDDNHGNLRTVPTKKMQNHNGGYGMYYHFDYHGSPFSYEWINTSFLPKIKEQMCAAYEFGIRELWIVNVGDILTNEFPLSYFLDLAYDYETYGNQTSTTQDYTKNWISKNFEILEKNQKDEIYEIINGYTKLANLRRTECLQSDTFHPVNFGEADFILQKAENLIQKAQNLRNQIPQSVFSGFYTQVYYPCCGTMNVLRMQLYSGKNNWLASKNALCANFYAKKVKECLEFDKNLVDELDKIDDGKFFAMGWSEHFGFTHWCEAENKYPVYDVVEPTRKKRIVVWTEGNSKTTSGQDWTDKNLFVDAFKNPNVNETKIFVADCSNEKANIELKLQKNTENIWLSYEISEYDEEKHLQIITLKIDREKLNYGKDKKILLLIESNDGHGAKIQVNIDVDANVPSFENFPEGTFVQTTNFISIEAEHFNFSRGFSVLKDYGKTLGAVKATSVTENFPKSKNTPFVEYKFAVKKDGLYSFDFYLNPSNPAYKDNKLQFVVQINKDKILKDVVEPNFVVGDNQEPWGTDVTNNIRIVSVEDECNKGLNVLRFYPTTPNIVLEKIVIHLSDYKMPKSYLGAPETFRFLRK